MVGHRHRDCLGSDARERIRLFLQDVVAIPKVAGVVLIVVVLGAMAIWGIRESAALAVAITFIEVGGLVFVVFAGRHYLVTLPERWSEVLPPVVWSPWPGIPVGAFLAFYSLIGFEDMVNVAEEVRNPRRNLPREIILALGITTILYVSVTTVAVLAIPPASLAESRTPLAAVLRQSGYESTLAISVVSMLAGINGALVQMIMASRIVYGMARKEMAPGYFGAVATSTPVRATVLVIGLVLVFALWLPLLVLARLTSAIILVIFSVVNLSLIRIKRLKPPPPRQTFPRGRFGSRPLDSCYRSPSSGCSSGRLSRAWSPVHEEALFHREHRNRRSPNYLLRDAARQEMFELAVPACSHDNQVGFFRLGHLEDAAGDIVRFRDLGVERLSLHPLLHFTTNSVR